MRPLLKSLEKRENVRATIKYGPRSSFLTSISTGEATAKRLLGDASPGGFSWRTSKIKVHPLKKEMGTDPAMFLKMRGLMRLEGVLAECGERSQP